MFNVHCSHFRSRGKLRIEEYEDEDVVMIQNLKGMGKEHSFNPVQFTTKSETKNLNRLI